MASPLPLDRRNAQPNTSGVISPRQSRTPPSCCISTTTCVPFEYTRPPGTPHDTNMAIKGKRDFGTRAETLSNALKDSEYLLSSGFSGADILIGHSYFMATITELIDGYPKLQACHERLQQRLAYQRTYN